MNRRVLVPRRNLVQPHNPRHHAGQRLRNLRIGHQRRIPPSAHLKAVQLRMENPAHIPRRRRHCQHRGVVHHPVHAQPLPLQPRRNLRNVQLRNPKPLAELLRRQPLVILLRGRLLLPRHQIVQRRLLLRAPPQHDIQLQRQPILHKPKIRIARQISAHIARKRNQPRAVDRLRYPGRGSARAARRLRRKIRGEGQGA